MDVKNKNYHEQIQSQLPLALIYWIIYFFIGLFPLYGVCHESSAVVLPIATDFKLFGVSGGSMKSWCVKNEIIKHLHYFNTA